MYVGTGDSPLTLPFYEKCGFKVSYRVKDFFIANYHNLIYEYNLSFRYNYKN